MYGKTIGIKSIKLPLDQEINFKVNYSYFNNNMSTIYIKHLTFWEPLKIRIRIGNFTKEISKVSDKLQFSETMIEIPAEFLDKPIQIQSLSDEVNFIGKRIVPEIDWIEVEN